MKWYVYELVDPRTEKPFYIGKGSGNRMRQHLGPSASLHIRLKVEKIRNAGFEPICREIAYFWEEADSLNHEAALIQSTDGLVNIVRNKQRPVVYTLFNTVASVVEGKLMKPEAKRRLNVLRNIAARVNDDISKKLYIQLIDGMLCGLR